MPNPATALNDNSTPPIKVDPDIVEKLTTMFNHHSNQPGGAEKIVDLMCTMAQHIRDQAGVRNTLENRLATSERNQSIYAVALMQELDRAGEPIVILPERIEAMPPGTAIKWAENSQGVVTVSLIEGYGGGDC